MKQRQMIGGFDMEIWNARMEDNEFRMRRAIAHWKVDKEINDREYGESLRSLAANEVDREFHTYSDGEKAKWLKFAEENGYTL